VSPAPASRRDRLTLGAYRFGWTAVRRLPERPAYALFDLLADAAWRRRGAGVRRLEANLRRVRPGVDDDALRQLSRAGLRSYLRYWCDLFRLPDWDEQRITSTCAHGGGRAGAGHPGSGPGRRDVPRPSRQLGPRRRLVDPAPSPRHHRGRAAETRELFDQFAAFRERLGMTIVPLGDPAVFRTLMTTLRHGGFVPLLADRDLTDGGTEVSFFGEPARMAVGPAALALQTGAALHPVSIHYERRGRRWGIVITWHAEVVPSERPKGSAATRAAVAAMTQSCADALAGAIEQHPQDWHMLQRVLPPT
jgi:KDO2-lipid IV(A) lauroyltransferase